jgi:hypothetical protein
MGRRVDVDAPRPITPSRHLKVDLHNALGSKQYFLLMLFDLMAIEQKTQTIWHLQIELSTSLPFR